MDLHHLHLARILSLGKRWKKEEVEEGHIKKENFLWKMCEGGGEEEEKSPSNTRASFASNGPSTEAG